LKGLLYVKKGGRTIDTQVTQHRKERKKEREIKKVRRMKASNEILKIY
jgi:hypothetical protein